MTTNKKTNKDINTTEIIAMGGLFTALTAPFSVPIAMATGAITALGAATTHLTKSNKDTEGKYYLTKWDQLFLSNEIYAKDMGEGIRLPKLQRVTEIPLGKMYVFKLPLGIESSDIRRIATSIKEAYGSLKIEIELLEPQLVAIIQQFEDDESEKPFEGTVSNEDWNTLWRSIKITTKDEFTDELIYPILINECEEDEIKTFTFKLPIGRSSAAFTKEEKATTIKEFLNARQIKIIPIANNCVQIVAVYKELPSMVRYELVPRSSKDGLEVVIGKTIHGWKRLNLLSGLHNVFIGGVVGSGKSVCVNTMITDLALNYSPEDLKMWLVDLKVVELSHFEKLKHVEKYGEEADECLEMIDELIVIMKDRYQKMKAKEVKSIAAYNKLVSKEEKMPYILFLIEEISELILKATKNEIATFVRLISKCRGAGIIVACTSQRIVNDYIPRNVSSQLANRICFNVTTSNESDLLTDKKYDATQLMGNGHGCLIDFDIEEFQGTYLDENKKEVTNLLRQHNLLRD